MNKVILFLLLYVASFTANAEDLILVSYPDQFFGESKLYIKNVGDKPNVVLTANLANASSDLDQNFLVPYTFVKIDGEQALTGALVIAYIAGQTCGVSVIDLDGTYVIDVEGGAKCGGEGESIQFTVNGLGVSEIGIWKNVVLNKVDLNASVDNPVDTGATQESKPASPVIVESKPVIEMYVVSAGDTCSEIAYDNDLELSELLALNGLTEPDCWSLEIGQILRIAKLDIR